MKSTLRPVSKLYAYLGRVEKRKRRENQLSKSQQSLESDDIVKFQSDLQNIQKIKRFNQKYLGGYKDVGWNMLFTITSGVKSEKYIPEDVWVNHIEPRLNSHSYTPALDDKNIYDNLFEDCLMPKTLFRYSKGIVLDKNFNPIDKKRFDYLLEKTEQKIILKPSCEGTGQGRGIKLYRKEDFDELTELFYRSNKVLPDIIAQEFVDVHENLKQLNPNSANTHKILTCRIGSEIKYLMGRLRIAPPGEFNEIGGFFTGIMKNGKLKTPLMDSAYKKHYTIDGINTDLTNFVIPGFKKSIETCLQLHRRLLHFNVVTWDMTINKSGNPVLIEFNTKSQGIAEFQVANGPLFGEYTEQLLEKTPFKLFLKT